jgi:hypothetical protein
MSIDTTQGPGRVAFSLVKSTKTTDYPDGNAITAWRKLKSKYAPDTAPTTIKISKLFHASVLKNGYDPEVWVTYLEDLRYQMDERGMKMSDIQFLTHIINNLTEEYETLVDILGRRIGAKTQALTVDELREELGLRYERIKNRKEGGATDNNSNKEEHAMFAGGKFKGKCNHCGTYGHKSKDCWVRDPSKKPKGRNVSGNSSSSSSVSTMTNTTSNNNNNNNNSNRTTKFNGECFYCKKFGHRASDCYKKKKDEENRNNNNNTIPETDEVADMVMMAWYENGELWGRCYECYECGPVGHYCETCGDMSVVYEQISEEDSSNIRARYYEEQEMDVRRNRSLRERIIEGVTTEYTDESPELELFISIVGDELKKPVQYYSEYVINRVDGIINMHPPIYTVQGLMMNLHRLLKFDVW